MKLLVAVIDTATFDLAARSLPGLRSQGFTIEWLAYNHSAELLEKVVTFADANSVRIYIPKLLSPLPAADWAKLWVANPLRAGWHGLAASAVLFSMLELKRRLIRMGRLGPRKWRNLDNVAALTFGFLRDRDTLKKLLREVGCDAVVLHHDFVGHMTATLARQARKQRITVVLRPALVPAPDRLATALAKRAANKPTTRIARLVVRSFPSWVKKVDGGVVMRLPWAHILALNLSGLGSRRPWLHQSSPVDFISLAQPSQVAQYTALGFRKSLIRVNPNRDDRVPPPPLAPEQRATIVAAIPPNQFLVGPPPGQFASYDALIDGFLAHLQTLARRYDIWLAPHPKDQTRYLPERLVERYTLCEGSTLECLKRAHGLFTYSGSATVHWREEAGRAVVTWDPYGYGAESAVLTAADQTDTGWMMERQLETMMAFWEQADAANRPPDFAEQLEAWLQRRR